MTKGTTFPELLKTRNARQGKFSASTLVSAPNDNDASEVLNNYQASESHFKIEGSNIDSDSAARVDQYMPKNWDGDGGDVGAESGGEDSDDKEDEITNVRTWGSGGIDPLEESRAKELLSKRFGRPFGSSSDTEPTPKTKSNGIKSDGVDSAKSGRDQTSHTLYEKELKDSEVEAHNLPGRGRGLIAKKLIQPGDVIIKVQPSISTLQNQYLKRICHGCFLSMDERHTLICKNEREKYEKKLKGELKTKLNRCSRCKVLHYCSKECQIADWPLHKAECIALQRFRKMYHNAYPNRPMDDEDLSWANQSGETVRALARIIWKRRVDREKSGGKDGIWWKQIASMESHVSKSPEKEVMKLAQQAQHLQHYLSASIPLKAGSTAEDENELKPVDIKDFGFENVREVMDFCSSFHVNSFTLSSPSLTPLGVSNSPLMALSNHSCDPNAIVVFPNGGQYMELIAIKDIQVDEEISTSYIDISCPYHIRQSDLLERYRFSCNCTICEKSKDPKSNWVDPRWCVKHNGCKKGEGQGKMPSPGSSGAVSVRCDACDEDFQIDVGEVLMAIQKGKDILDCDERQSLDDQSAKNTLKTLIPTLQQLIPNHSFPLLSLLRLSTLLHNPPQSPQDLEISIKHIKEASEGSLKVYPTNHATPTLILAEYAKLSSLVDTQGHNLDRFSKDSDIWSGAVMNLLHATTIIRRAIEGCKLSFGHQNTGGVVGKQLKGILEGCEDELARVRYQSRNLT